MVRPEISPDARRTKTHPVRLSPTEHARISAGAKLAGLNVSDFIRNAALEAARDYLDLKKKS